MDRYRVFYESAGRLYPEDEITYSSLGGNVRKKWVIEKMRRMPPGRLLDCGCNVGRLGSFWEKGSACGFDIAFSVLRRGKTLFPRVLFVNGDARNPGFIRSRSIDSAIAIEVVEHLDRPEDFLRGLNDLLKSGGQALITCPGYTRARPRYLKLGIVKSFGVDRGPEGTDAYLHTAYRPEELAAMAVKAGFSIIEAGSFEHETRFWNKPLVMLANYAGGFGAVFFPRSRLNSLLLKALHRLEQDLFLALDLFGFSKLLRSFLKHGRRTYVLLQKK